MPQKKFRPDSFANREPTSALGELLRKTRARRRLNLVDAAEKIGVSKATYTMWERGGSIPRPIWRGVIAEYCGVAEATIWKLLDESAQRIERAYPESKLDWVPSTPLGWLIRDTRERNQDGFREAGAGMNVNHQTAKNWESGTKTPRDPRKYRAIAEYCGVKPEFVWQLLSGERTDWRPPKEMRT